MKVTQEFIDDLNLFKGLDTERDIEYPFLFDWLPEPPGTLLDVGCDESELLIELNKLGFNAIGIDLRDYGLPCDTFVLGDARAMPFEDDSMDVSFSISTIEHVGLVETPYFTDAVCDEEGDLKVVQEMIRVTRPGGLILITIPLGSGDADQRKWIRFYDTARVGRISELLSAGGFTPRIFPSVQVNKRWIPTDLETACRVYSSDVHIYSCCCIAAPGTRP